MNRNFGNRNEIVERVRVLAEEETKKGLTIGGGERHGLNKVVKKRGRKKRSSPLERRGVANESGG